MNSPFNISTPSFPARGCNTCPTVIHRARSSPAPETSGVLANGRGFPVKSVRPNEDRVGTISGRQR